jgi:hypothetical protein
MAREFKEFVDRTNEIENIIGELVEDSPKTEVDGAQTMLNTLHEEVAEAFDDTDDEEEEDILDELSSRLDEAQVTLDDLAVEDEDEADDDEDDSSDA